MPTARHLHSRDVGFRMEDITGASFGLSADGNECSIDLPTSMVDSRTYGQKWALYDADITDYTVNFSGYWCGVGSDSATCKLLDIKTASVGTWFELSPAGSLPTACATCTNYSGCVWLENLNVSFPAAGVAAMSFSLKPRSGSLSVTTGSWT